jgi:hypothetical protein
MVLASVADTSFAILLLFSLPHAFASAHPFLAEGVGEGASSPIRLTPAPTHTRVVAIARPRGRFIARTHHRFRRR